MVQENEALRVSLESSERIRKQQKDLIQLLQHTNSLVDKSAISLNSAASMSTIHPLPSANEATRISHDFSAAAPSLEAENRSW